MDNRTALIIRLWYQFSLVAAAGLGFGWAAYAFIGNGLMSAALPVGGGAMYFACLFVVQLVRLIR